MGTVSRRQFLHQSLAAGAAVGACPRIARADAPNSKLGVAVVGVRGRGQYLLSAFLADPRTRVAAIVEVDQAIGQNRQQAIAERQGWKPKLFRDMREAFADASIDLVAAGTPNHWHSLCGIWAMQAGKDVYIEKPVSHNVAEGSALVAAARKYRRMCQVGTQARSLAAMIDAMKFLHDGGIGTVRFARGLVYTRRRAIGPKGDYPVPPDVDFNLWNGPAVLTDPRLTRPRFHYDWHWQRLYGNGELGNRGSHITDIVRWGLGVDTHPVSVIAYGGRLGYQAERNDPSYVDAGDTPNTQVAIYDYGDKCIVFEVRGLSVDGSADEQINRLVGRDRSYVSIFYGSEGFLVQHTFSHCTAYDKDGKAIRKFTGGGDHVGNFIDACISRQPQQLNCDAREGHLSAAACHLGDISYYLGEQNKVSIDEARRILADVNSLDDNLATLDRTARHLTDNGVDLKKEPISIGPLLKFDPQREVFPDSHQATALTTREYREGFLCPTPDAV